MELLGQLADIERREHAIKKLTTLYGATMVIVFIRDEDIDAFLPGPGFTQTLPDGIAWRDFLSDCPPGGVHVGTLSSAAQSVVTAVSYERRTIFAIVDGSPTEDQLHDITLALPFLAPLLHLEANERHAQVKLTQAEASVAENMLISKKLDSTRRELQKALIRTRDEIEMIKKSQEIKDRVDSLTRQRNDLMKINKIKDEFVSIASHQLRTPATAVKQYIGLLLNEYAGKLSAEQHRFLEIAYSSNERQLDILNDLLKTAQLDSRGYVLQKKQKNIVHLVEDIIAQLENVFAYKNQTVNLVTTNSDIPAMIDEEEIKLALTNLIENASKYTYPGKSIVVDLALQGDYVQISIKDEGVGISKENQRRIFDKFTRVDNALSDTVSGSGLGLYLVKRIIKLHKGTIKVSSEINHGTTFVVKLPV